MVSATNYLVVVAIVPDVLGFTLDPPLHFVFLYPTCFDLDLFYFLEIDAKFLYFAFILIFGVFADKPIIHTFCMYRSSFLFKDTMYVQHT